MIEEEIVSTFKKEPKDKKRSLRQKYKRRLIKLADALDQFLAYSEERLNSEITGNIHKRKMTEKLYRMGDKLRSEINIKSKFEREKVRNETIRSK